jgi:hypothetical protein
MSDPAEKRPTLTSPGLKFSQTGKKYSFCSRCFGKGIAKEKSSARYVVCHCGRPMNSWAAHKMSAQAKLDKRLEELKGKGW